MGCNIDKMLIKGIRSFSPDNQNVIEFYRPLTLIVGQNGAGKTTVIECLKMACTGELPPNTRSGQSFIHDPKVAGETEVKAQIKLRFLTATRQPVVVIRSFQLTQKKTNMQFKALDNVLQTINRATGQKEALSYRCADIDRIVPSLMGVSKAILENVIFVHQEDSNWPLAEGQVLKKKFDDIFAATKYTKALEALRKLRTEKGQEVKEMRLKLEHLKSNRDVAQKLRNEVDDGTERVHKLELQIAEIEGDMAAVEAHLRQLNGQLSAIADYGDERTQLQVQHDMLEAQNAETFARLLSAYGPEDIELSVEDLEAYEAELVPKFSEADLELKRMGRDIQSKLMEVEAIKERFTRDVKNQGRLAAEADAHTRNCADRDRFLHTLAAEAGLPAPSGGANGALSPEAVSEFVSAFDGKVREVAGRLEKTKAEHRAADDDHGRSIDKVSAELSGAAEGVRMKTDALRRNEAQLSQLGSALEACVVNAGLLQDAKSRLSDLEARLGAKQTALSQSSYEEEGRKCTASLAELAAKASGLRTERDRLASAADQASQMRYKSNEVAQRRQQVDSLLAVRRTKLESLLGVKELPALDRLREGVEVALSKRRREQEQASKRLKEVQQKLSTKAGEVEAVSSQLHRLQAELEPLARELEGKLQETCGGQVQAPLAECAHKAEEERQTHLNGLAQVQAFKTMSTHIIKTANDTNTCLTCSRPFANPAEKQRFLAHQEQQNKEMPSKAAELQQKLQAAERRVQKLKALQPIALRHDQLRDKEVPDLTRRLDGLQQEVKALEEEEEEAQEVFAAAEAEAQECQSLLQEAAWPIDRLAKEIKEREREVESLKSEVAATTATRTVAEVDGELEDLEHERTKLEAGREEANRKLQRLRDEVSSLRTEFHKAREEVTRLGSTAEKRDALQAQIAELSADSVRVREEIKGADAARKPLEAKKAQLLQERERLRGEARAREAEIEGQLRKLNTLETQLQAKQRAIEEYKRGGRAEALEKVNATLEALRAQQDAGERAVKGLQDRQRTKESETRSFGDTKRQVEDCLAYARSKARLEGMKAKLEGLEASMGQVGDRSAMQHEYKELEVQQTELRSKRDTHLGSVATIKDNVLRAEDDLRNPAYEGIEERYRRQLIELKTTEMANSDLEKYHKALEKALLAFHTSKMADINKVVKELWQKTYRNSDIDYIAIRTDSEGGAARSYNYRVAMYCGGAELDMRGRCSAGQKVLACLIIRLALAETFCLNCGILALDEPTTNLDAANAASLAESLRTIMQSRRDQENFQLVVITHDEQFAHLIGTREYCDFYWRITKDTDQHTHIAQEEIGE